jgi:DNA ligase-1
MISAPDEITVARRGGVFLPESGLWLDPHSRRDFAFVSHAHSDHFARHERLLCSPATRELILARYGHPKKTSFLTPDFGEILEFDGFEARLLPAGHILGSAQLHLTRKRDGATLLYTGDFKLRPNFACESAEFLPARTLIMETTFGLPRFVFPPTESIVDDVTAWVGNTLAEGSVPMLLAYSLGKAQEILSALRSMAPPLMLHESVVNMTAVYQRFGHAFPDFRPLDPNTCDGHVILAPPHIARKPPFGSIPRTKAAMLSGWGLNPSAKYQYRVDHVFPLSDHADYPDLLETVRRVDPRKVLTLHGYSAPFARDLRNLGLEAWSLESDDQLEFRFDSAG